MKAALHRAEPEMRISRDGFSLRRNQQRGFTLMELMAVVAIVGILSTIAVFGVRKYIFAAKSSEVVSIMTQIAGAQESYRSETFQYLNVSTSIDAFYPAAAPGRTKYAWDTLSGDAVGNWRALGVHTTQPVQYVYATVAGDAGAAPPATGARRDLQYPTAPKEPWFVMKAVGDVNGDGVQSLFVGSSFTSEIYSQDEDE